MPPKRRSSAMRQLGDIWLSDLRHKRHPRHRACDKSALFFFFCRLCNIVIDTARRAKTKCSGCLVPAPLVFFFSFLFSFRPNSVLVQGSLTLMYKELVIAERVMYAHVNEMARQQCPYSLSGTSSQKKKTRGCGRRSRATHGGVHKKAAGSIYTYPKTQRLARTWRPSSIIHGR